MQEDPIGGWSPTVYLAAIDLTIQILSQSLNRKKKKNEIQNFRSEIYFAWISILITRTRDSLFPGHTTRIINFFGNYLIIC